MSVIQRIRDKGAWIIFGIIALALIAFILQDGLSRKMNIFANTSTVGKINGVAIEKNDFDKKVDLIQQTNQQAANMKREELVAGVWNLVVNETILNQEYDKLGLKVTPKELSDILFGSNPPQWMQQIFTDPNTGVFNMEQAKAQFAQLKKKSNDPQAIAVEQAYLQPTIDQTLRQKYQSLVTGAVYVPKWMAEKMNADNNAISSISYVFVPYLSVNDSTIKISDDEVKTYIDKHSNQFKQDEETRTVSYVAFDANPSAQDSAVVYNQLKDIKADFAAATDDKGFLASKGSATNFYDSYLSKAEIKQPFKDSLFVLNSGQVYGPYLDNTDYAIAKLIAVKQLPDSAKVRHILVLTHQSNQQTGQFVQVRDDSTAKKLLDSAVLQLNKGVSFDSVCLKYSEDPGSKEKGGVYDYFPTGRMDPAFNDFSFTGKVGEKRIIKTSYGYHYVEILGQKGNQPAYKFAYISKPITVSAETDVNANNAANQFAAASRELKTFQQNAAKQNKPILPAEGIKENDFNVGILGESRSFVRWVYENNVGDVSEPTKINNKYIVAIITNANKAGLQNVATARPQVENILKNEKKAQQIINTKIKGNTLEAMAQSSSTNVQKADSVSFQSPFIPSVGNEPKMIGAAFDKTLQGKVSSPIAGNTGVYAVKVESIGAKSSLDNNPQIAQQNLENGIKQRLAGSPYGGGSPLFQYLRNAATVKDYRSKFY